jgi:hypothetical protein
VCVGVSEAGRGLLICIDQCQEVGCVREKKTMAMTAGQFFLYLLIIIILRESLASAASPTLEASAGSISVFTIPAGTVFH